MSMEISQGTSQSQSTGASASSASSTDTRFGKGKGEAGGGFMAILDAMSEDTSLGVTAAGNSGLSSASAGPGSAHDGTATTTTPGTDALTNAVPDAATLLALNPQVVNPHLLAQLEDPVASSAMLASGTAGRIGLSSAVAATVATVATGPSAITGAPIGAAGQPGKGVLHARSAPAAAVQSQDSSEDQSAKLASEQSAAAQAKASLNTDANPASADASTSGAGSASEQAAAADPRNNKLMAAIAQLQSAQSDGATTAVASLAPLVAQAGSGKAGADRSVTAAKASDTSYGATPNLSPTPATYTATASGATSAAPEVQVAEQVKFWISQDVQHAQMKLDGLGKDPVQVSISMNGNQASIAFQTDESQTRSVLEGAAAHLKDMLGREGVLLAGVSIGTTTSGQGGNNGANSSGGSGSGQSARQSARQSVVGMTAAVNATVRTNQSVLPAGRSLDLFV